MNLNASNVVDLCDEFAERKQQERRERLQLEADISYLKTWAAAYRMVNKENDITDDDVKARWRKAGYGGLR